MSTVQFTGEHTKKFLPVREAVTLVPYTRDYVARLCREGRISAEQRGRQWYVDVDSLQNFYHDALFEESVRGRVLRQERLREREVKNFLQAAVAHEVTRLSAVGRMSHVSTAAVLLGGFCFGFLLLTVLPHALYTVNYFPAALVAAQQSRPAVVPVDTYGDHSAFETVEEFLTDQGVLIFPRGADRDRAVSPTELFSDPVVLERTGSTTGVVRVEGDKGTSVPFVLVPVTEAALPTSL